MAPDLFGKFRIGGIAEQDGDTCFATKSSCLETQGQRKDCQERRAELNFYSRVFGIETADVIEPVEIVNF